MADMHGEPFAKLTQEIQIMMKKNFRTYTESGTCLPDGSSPTGNHYERGSAGKIRAGACLTALCILLSVPAFAESVTEQPAVTGSSSQIEAPDGSTSAAAAAEGDENIKTPKKIPFKNLPKMEHRPRHGRNKHNGKDLVYDTLTKEEAAKREEERKAEEARRAAEAAAATRKNSSSSKKSSSKKSSSKKKSSKKKSSGGYKVIQY